MKELSTIKELSIEEKAKRYDEAIERGLGYIRHTPATVMVTRQDIFEAIFPELKESEEEKLSKKLHECVCMVINNDRVPYEERKYISEQVIPYLENLEKQKEQKPIEQKPTWSEEDEKMLDKLIKHFDWESGYYFSKNDCDKAQEWLKSLRPQNSITDEELAQAKKQAYNDALDKIEYHSGEPTFDDGWSAAIWYLKNKNIQFGSTWKPTEEQMSCLAYTIDKDDCCGKDYTILKSLYDTLKELV